MLYRHHQSSQPVEPHYTGVYISPGSELDPLQIAVQEYLDQVCAPLVGKMPYVERIELRMEIEQHFRALIEAHQELGATAERAFSLAVEKFGKPDEVAQRWRPQTASRSMIGFSRRWVPAQWQRLCLALVLTGVMGLSALNSIQSTWQKVNTETGLQRQMAQVGQGDHTQLRAHAGLRHTDFANMECSQCHRNISAASSRPVFSATPFFRQAMPDIAIPSR